MTCSAPAASNDALKAPSMRKQIQPVSAAGCMGIESRSVFTLVDKESKPRSYLARRFPARVDRESQTTLQDLEPDVTHRKIAFRERLGATG